MANCACGQDWRIEACDLATGRVRAILHPTMFNWQTELNDFGQGSMTFHVQDVPVRDIWPHLTSVYILRLRGGDATPENPVVEFAGILETFSGRDEGTLQVGMVSIEDYLNNRLIRSTIEFENVPLTEIARDLVRLAQPNGIPLGAIADSSQVRRGRTYEVWDRKQIGEAIVELTQVIDGPDWELRHSRSDQGEWTTEMIFRDFVGSDRDVIVFGREASSFALEVDAKGHGTFIDAVGEGSEEDQLFVHVEDDSGIYPRFDRSPAWTDVSRRQTLQDHAEGYLEDRQEPIATPYITLRGFDRDPASMQNGDIITMETNFGAATYKGKGRILSTSWAVSVDNAPARWYQILPLTRASQSVLSQTPTDDCKDC